MYKLDFKLILCLIYYYHMAFQNFFEFTDNDKADNQIHYNFFIFFYKFLWSRKKEITNESKNVYSNVTDYTKHINASCKWNKEVVKFSTTIIILINLQSANIIVEWILSRELLLTHFTNWWDGSSKLTKSLSLQDYLMNQILMLWYR